jgi:hypothetical protein
VIHPNANMVELIAKAIARCDFRTTISKYVSSDDWSWVITVGESNWQRHLAVVEISPDSCDAVLNILKPEQSTKFGYDLNTNDVESSIKLSDLIAGSYVGVKNLLKPKSMAA